VGNHSQHHPIGISLYLRHLLRSEIRDAQQAISKVIGRKPIFYRQPLSLINPLLLKPLKEEALTLVGFSLYVGDNQARSPEEIADYVAKRLRNGQILALHDGLANRPHERDRSVRALPLILNAHLMGPGRRGSLHLGTTALRSHSAPQVAPGTRLSPPPMHRYGTPAPLHCIRGLKVLA
jgi:hypothetical protein